MNKKKLAILLLVLMFIGLFFGLDLDRFLTLESLKANHQRLLAFYADQALLTVLVFVLIYVVQTTLALPGATILSLAAGAVFGPWLGTIYAVSAATCGAVLSFLVSRHLVRDVVLQHFGHRLEPINLELERRGFSYLLFLRLVPLVPFFLINLAAGLTRLPLRTFTLGTFLGIIPGGFVYVNAGASLATINAIRDIASPRVLGSFALLGLFALMPVWYAKFRSRNLDSP